MARVLIGNFKGPKGDPGERGLQGIQGIQGLKGDKGDPGDVSSVAGIKPDEYGDVPLKIGGANLLMNTGVEKHLVRSNTNVMFSYTLAQVIPVESPYAYALSFEIRNDAEIEVFCYFRTSTASIKPNIMPSKTLQTSDTYRKITAILSGSGDDFTQANQVYINISSGSGNIWIRNVKLERGNIPTAWTPAPEDLLHKNVTPIFGVPYTPRDLTEVHKEEITDGYSGDPWGWVQARIKAGNFDSMNIEDYIPVTCTNGSNKKFNSRIGGINTYKDYGNVAIGNHIDFISDTVWTTTFKMNLANFNNGLDNDNQFPWVSSNGYHFINSLEGDVPNATTNQPETDHVNYTNDGIYYHLPDTLKNVIVEKLLYLPKRFSASGALTDDNSGGWTNIGKLWLPTEFEVAGANIWGSSKYGATGSVQYPLFANNANRNIGLDAWWTISATSGSTTSFVYVTAYAGVNTNSASNNYRCPICFRVA